MTISTLDVRPLLESRLRILIGTVGEFTLACIPIDLPIACGGRATPGGIFPLGLRREPVRPTGKRSEPLGVGQRIIEGHADDWHRPNLSYFGVAWIPPGCIHAVDKSGALFIYCTTFPAISRRDITRILDENGELRHRDFAAA